MGPASFDPAHTARDGPQAQRDGPVSPQCGEDTGPTHILARVTSKPTEPPHDGPAVEVPPHGEQWRPKVTVYGRALDAPMLWIYLDTGWALAAVRARHDYPNGLTAYQVEISIPNGDGTSSRYLRTYAWGKDNIRPA